MFSQMEAWRLLSDISVQCLSFIDKKPETQKDTNSKSSKSEKQKEECPYLLYQTWRTFLTVTLFDSNYCLKRERERKNSFTLIDLRVGPGKFEFLLYELFRPPKAFCIK
jgi:hypothetical protein